MQDLLASSVFEVLVGVIFVLFWLISAAVGQVAKKKEEAERRRRMEQMSRESGGGTGADLPPVLPPRDLNTGVTTRAEMERRIREAQARRSQPPPTPPPTPPPAPPTTYRDAPPIPADPTSVFEDPQAELRRRNDEERQRREAAHRQQEKRRQAEERERKKAEQYRKAERRRMEQERRERDERDRESSQPHFAAPHLRVHRVVSNDPVQLTEQSPTSGQRPPTADAATLRSWLNPRTLRHQYILTELLSPPVALRPEREY
jgi:hypothetical protein